MATPDRDLLLGLLALQNGLIDQGTLVAAFQAWTRDKARPHRGIPQESLPLYLGFFEFVHNVRARGRTLLGALIGHLLTPPCNPS